MERESCSTMEYHICDIKKAMQICIGHSCAVIKLLFFYLGISSVVIFLYKGFGATLHYLVGHRLVIPVILQHNALFLYKI